MVRFVRAMCEINHNKYTIFQNRQGWIVITATLKGIKQLVLPKYTREEAAININGIENYIRDDEHFVDICRQVTAYLDGENKEIKCMLDCSEYTDFQLSILRITEKIPYGETRSYKWIAEKIGTPFAYRAVGQALAMNRTPILIPCHRVICKNGDTGGFAGKNNDIDFKIMLLNLEQKAAKELKSANLH